MWLGIYFPLEKKEEGGLKAKNGVTEGEEGGFQLHMTNVATLLPPGALPLR